MDVPVTAGPWLVLGVVLGALLSVLVTAGSAGLRRRRHPLADPAPSADAPVDDLPGFLESPPGSSPAGPAADGWAALSTPPPAPPQGPAAPERRTTRDVLTAMALTALLLIGAAAAVATTGTRDPAGRDGPPPTPATREPGAVSARLAFEGVVLERYAVGVAVGYPRVEVSTDHGTTTARLELPTWNCLRGDPPEDPGAAGCTATVPEYAELSSPGLRVQTRDGTLRLSGRFATSRRFNGSSPEPTGRVYELTVTATPRDGRGGQGSQPATGVLTIGDGRAATADDAANAIALD